MRKIVDCYIQTASFYTELGKLFIHSELLRRASFYTEEHLHREAFTYSNLHTESAHTARFYTEKLLHRETLHGEAFTRRSIYTEKILHTASF